MPRSSTVVRLGLLLKKACHEGVRKKMRRLRSREEAKKEPRRV
jgi:hypothetical protein